MSSAAEIAGKLTEEEAAALRYVADNRTIAGGTKTMHGLLRGLAKMELVRFHTGREIAPMMYEDTGIVSITELGDDVSRFV